MKLSLTLCAIDTQMHHTWSELFADVDDVQIKAGNILDHKADAILSPANSFGFMDGGIDLAYSHHFGWELETNVKSAIAEQFHGEMPVGCAVVVATQRRHIPWLVSAPTMRVPQSIQNTVNVYLAFRAALLAIKQHNRTVGTPIASLLSPALGAGIGNVPPDRVAAQMLAAYREVVLGDVSWRHNAKGALRHHASLLA